MIRNDSVILSGRLRHVKDIKIPREARNDNAGPRPSRYITALLQR